jgi:catechol 2,3-dioxygenase-like lactoylglutathione lyase family enzyme
MVKVESVVHPVVTVADMERSLAFYRDLLGMTVTFDGDVDPAFYTRLSGLPDPDLRTVLVTCPDGGEIELIEYRRPRGSTTNERRFIDVGHSFITLRVRDIEAAVAELAGAGVPVVAEVARLGLASGGAMQAVYLAGPDGEHICLIETHGGRGLGD